MSTRQLLLNYILNKYPKFVGTNVCINGNLHDDKLFTVIYKEEKIGEFTLDGNTFSYKEYPKKKKQKIKRKVTKAKSFKQLNLF